MDKVVQVALADLEPLVAQTTTRLAAEEARGIALNQQVQAMQGQVPSILAALDSQTTNKVPRWVGAPGEFCAELWLNQVEMLRTKNKWMEEQTKEAFFLTMEGQAILRDEGPDVLATLAQFKEAFLKRFKKLKTSTEYVELVAQLNQTLAEICLDF